MSSHVSHIYSNARRHLATGLTALIVVSPIVPILAWSVNASESRRDSGCIDTVVFASPDASTIGSGQARVSRTCPGRIVPISGPSRSGQTTIDIRNINP
ncbi:unannotated protein [freshwater metagenome]|uniref:Unannotated protein n=1 Tax=freshwater metagenome TaxID=449393 RepID=A0A6J6ER67_9ZZZZ|nr:hypothetical protein [Actinomycetota bacterium]